VNHPSDSFDESLREYRTQLDAVDAQLISLLAERFSITSKIGELKAQHRAPPADPMREAVQLERLLARSSEVGLPCEVTQAVYATLFSLVRESHTATAARKRE
jgi:chorismate mutase